VPGEEADDGDRQRAQGESAPAGGEGPPVGGAPHAQKQEPLQEPQALVSLLQNSLLCHSKKSFTPPPWFSKLVWRRSMESGTPSIWGALCRPGILL